MTDNVLFGNADVQVAPGTVDNIVGVSRTIGTLTYSNLASVGFHTTQINAAAPWGLLSRIGAAPAGCFNTTDDIFFDAFEKPGG